MTPRAAKGRVREGGLARLFWLITNRNVTTNQRDANAASCTCTVAVHDKGRRVIQNVGCPLHDTTARSIG